VNPTGTVGIASLQVQTPSHQHFFIGEEALDVMGHQRTNGSPKRYPKISKYVFYIDCSSSCPSYFLKLWQFAEKICRFEVELESIASLSI
jgi:hypothetical protein